MWKLAINVWMLSLAFHGAVAAQDSKSPLETAPQLDLKDSAVLTALKNIQTARTLDGSWVELSFERRGFRAVEQEFDDRLGKSIDADVYWFFSNQDKPTHLTRSVARGNTEVTDGNLFLGSHTVDTTKKPAWITFERAGHTVGGIFRFEEDELWIALPPRKWDHQRGVYIVGKRPTSFTTTLLKRKSWEPTFSDDVTVYRLSRRPQDD